MGVRQELSEMSVLRIQGGKPLRGTIEIAGSKNAALAILSAVPLVNGVTRLRNLPDVRDVRIKLQLMEQYGMKVVQEGGITSIDSTRLVAAEVGDGLVRPIRTSFYLLGALLARLGKVSLPAPGGCKIGARPVDFHIKGLELMGAQIELDSGHYHASAQRLKGAEIYLDFPSAGATQHLMATATLAEGITVIQNAAMEPEVVALADFLKGAGAKIEGIGTSTIVVTGVDALKPSETRIPEDRLQASTYLLAAVITKGDVTVTGVMPEHQMALVNKLREAGADAEEGHDSVRVAYRGPLKGIRVKTMPYPGFPTDIQQPMAAVLTLAEGSSVVEETIYESRVGHVSELNRMGANMRLEGRSTLIEGVPSLSGAVVEASDLRAGAALVLAGLAAKGETIVRNVHFIDRGYEDLESSITHLGGSIERIPQEEWDEAQRTASSR